jgi:hypothetical protein
MKEEEWARDGVRYNGLTHEGGDRWHEDAGWDPMIKRNKKRVQRHGPEKGLRDGYKSFHNQDQWL